MPIVRTQKPPSLGVGRFVDQAGSLTPDGRIFLQRTSRAIAAMVDVQNLNPATTYTADQLRDKLIEVMTALGAAQHP